MTDMNKLKTSSKYKVIHQQLPVPLTGTTLTEQRLRTSPTQFHHETLELTFRGRTRSRTIGYARPSLHTYNFPWRIPPRQGRRTVRDV